MENVVRKDNMILKVTDNSIAYVGNPTNTGRKAWIKSGGDLRSYSSLNKQNVLSSGSSTPDVEARATTPKNKCALWIMLKLCRKITVIMVATAARPIARLQKICG